MIKYISIFFLIVFISQSGAQVKSELITYKDGDVELEGYLAYDRILKSVRGGVLLVHNANGRDKFIEERADELAETGYVVFALDMFGKGIHPESEEDQIEQASQFLGEDRNLMRERASRWAPSWPSGYPSWFISAWRSSSQPPSRQMSSFMTMRP